MQQTASMRYKQQQRERLTSAALRLLHLLSFLVVLHSLLHVTTMKAVLQDGESKMGVCIYNWKKPLLLH